jgi:hypothetical protein
MRLDECRRRRSRILRAGHIRSVLVPDRSPGSPPNLSTRSSAWSAMAGWTPESLSTRSETTKADCVGLNEVVTWDTCRSPPQARLRLGPQIDAVATSLERTGIPTGGARPTRAPRHRHIVYGD